MEPLESPILPDLDPTPEEKTMGMLAHLSALAMFIIPFGNIIGPLVVWLTQKDKSEFVNYHGKESLNFQITYTLALIISGILTLVLIGIVLLIVIGIAGLVFSIIAAIKANEGQMYQYPWKLTFVH